jgi:hypothetical protein
MMYIVVVAHIRTGRPAFSASLSSLGCMNELPSQIHSHVLGQVPAVAENQGFLMAAQYLRKYASHQRLVRVKSWTTYLEPVSPETSQSSTKKTF